MDIQKAPLWRRITAWLTWGLSFVILLIGSMIWFYDIIDGAQQRFCPLDSFLTGQPHGGIQGYLQSGGIVGLWLLLLLPLDRFAPGFTNLDTGKLHSRLWTRYWLAASAVVVLVLGGAAAIGTDTGFCLTDQYVQVREWPWSTLVRYKWSDIQGVSTTCRMQRFYEHGNSGPSPVYSFVLVARDGSRLDVLDISTAFERAYPTLVARLHPHIQRFDASGVKDDCPTEWRERLSKRP